MVGLLKPEGFYKRAFLPRAGCLIRHSGTIMRLVPWLSMLGEQPMSRAKPCWPRLRWILRTALVVRFLSEAQAMGARTVSLTTRAGNNDNVNRFYQRAGFTWRRTFAMPGGRRMNEYYCRV